MNVINFRTVLKNTSVAAVHVYIVIIGKKMHKIPILLKQCTYTIPENDHSSGAVNRIGILSF